NINIFYDEARQKTRVRLDLWIEGDMKIETDSVARINQLGLLGEQYLELAPGVEKHFLASGSEINGKNPVNVGQQMEGIREFVESATNIMQHIEKGEGTLGKFVMDDALYDDLVEIFTKIKSGEGTLGKLLMDDTLYNEMEGFASDIKAHPWKLIHKTSDRKKKKKEEETPRGTEISVKE
ncbi:MAG: hypothetical protein HQ594_00800, partial [Candidatus Omnitrophica bacterium]|nr:hypothetical protein [Candidatus Omnitrophota bacterium]